MPLQAVMAEDDERDPLALYSFKEFSGAGAELLFVLILGPCFAVEGKKALHHHCVDCQEYRPCLGQLDEHRLVPGDVPAGLDERQAGHEFGIAVDQPVAQRGMVPMRPCRRKPRMAAAGQLVMRALDNEFGIPECIVIAAVVNVEVGADEDINVRRAKAESSDLFDHIGFVLGR